MTASFRVDRFATLYLSNPLRRLYCGYNLATLTILMYHSISNVPERVSHPYFQTNTDPVTFRRHMEWLASNGYRSVPLNMIEEGMTWSSGREKVKPVVITVDDGFRDFRENAVPVLKRFDFTATVFLPTGHIGSRLRDRECLAWHDVRDLQIEGFEFGSHTVSHPNLHRLARKSIYHEIRDSKAAIEDATGKTVNTFSYPYAFPQENRNFIAGLGHVLREQGYQFGVTTCIGRVTPGQNPLFLRRIPLNMHDDELLLRAKMEGGYDWLKSAQYLSRVIKKWF